MATSYQGLREGRTPKKAMRPDDGDIADDEGDGEDPDTPPNANKPWFDSTKVIGVQKTNLRRALPELTKESRGDDNGIAELHLRV